MATVDLLQDGEIATLVLNHPAKLNAINLAMWHQLAAHLQSLSQGSPPAAGQTASGTPVRCVIIRGAGREAFAAGGDLEEFITERVSLSQALRYHDEVASALDAIANFPLPTVAMIQGACIGGGLEIAAACDLRIASDNACFGAPIHKLGFSMYPGEMAGLLQLAGPAVLKEILLEGRMLTARQAYEKGLLTRVVPDDELENEVRATSKRICSGAPLVAIWHKQWLRRLSSQAPLSDDEKKAAFAFLDTEDYREGLAAFLEKRKPNFKGK